MASAAEKRRKVPTITKEETTNLHAHTNTHTHMYSTYFFPTL